MQRQRDGDSGLIVEATLDGGHRRVVYDNGDRDVYTVVVDPVRRYLFWTESPRVNASQHVVDVRASDLRGGSVRTLARVEGGARSLGLDVTARRLYYVEGATVLAVRDYDSGEKAVVRTGLPHPPAFTVSNKQLFWTSSEGEVTTILKHNAGELTFPVLPSLCRRCSHVEKESMFGPRTFLRAVDGRMQPIPDTRHHWTRECLLNTTSYSDVCPCPFGHKTFNRSRTCREEGYFLTSFGSEIKAVSMKGKTLPLLYKGRTQLSAVDFHYIRGFLFWYDSTESKIFRSPALNPSLRQTVALMVRGTTALAVDWTYDHLYWTSNNRDGGGVEVCKLDGSVRLTVVPRDRASQLWSVAVHPEEGTMYVSNWTEGSVEVFGMDGTRVQRLASGLRQPRSLTLDLHGNEKQIYWLESIDYQRQGATTVVRACYLERGEDCRVVYKSLPGPRPSSLTVLANNVYWLDGTGISYIGVSQRNRPRRIHTGKKHTEPLALKAVHSRAQPPATNNCVFSACRGLCVPIPRDWGQTDVRCVQRRARYKPRHNYATIGL